MLLPFKTRKNNLSLVPFKPENLCLLDTFYNPGAEKFKIKHSLSH